MDHNQESKLFTDVTDISEKLGTITAQLRSIDEYLRLLTLVRCMESSSDIHTKGDENNPHFKTSMTVKDYIRPVAQELITKVCEDRGKV